MRKDYPYSQEHRVFVSFASNKFLGAVVLQDMAPEDVLPTINKLGLNPGGQVAMWRIQAPNLPMNTLITDRELLVNSGFVSMREASEEEVKRCQDRGVIVCEKCNTGQCTHH